MGGLAAAAVVIKCHIVESGPASSTAVEEALWSQYWSSGMCTVPPSYSHHIYTHGTDDLFNP